MTSPLDLARQTVYRLRENGADDVQRRIAKRLARSITTRFQTADLDFPLLAEDIADSTRLSLIDPAAPTTESSLKIAWVCMLPAPGSGGHTTLFRMVEEMERRGHKCTLLLYNRHGKNIDDDAAVIRKYWPQLTADIRHVPDVIGGYDVSVASSWEMAHVLATRGTERQHRFYFVQDFEPYFYPRGSEYALAEDTYRFGFRQVAIGHMVRDVILREVGSDSLVAPFGCDTSVYHLDNLGTRAGVAFYARPDVDRRGFLLAKLALTDFHRKHPDQPILVYGDKIDRWDVPHEHIGKVSPSTLNAVYNSAIAGIAMSFTNISLVAEEMLASGMTPIVNDSDLARLDFDNPFVEWAAPTPAGISDALDRAVSRNLSLEERTRASKSARSGWKAAQEIVATEIERVALGGTTTIRERGTNDVGTAAHVAGPA